MAGRGVRRDVAPIAAVALALAIGFGAPDAVAKQPPIATITVDLTAGVVLEEAEADALRRPASLTKVMTAYIAFEALEAGEVSETDEVTVSAAAAKQPPVGVGLWEGRKLPFGDLLRAAVIASGNDAAVAVAVAVSGSEAEFVKRMNKTAQALGMKNTIYGTASGLPEPSQVTTARDMALLAQAVLNRFPERSQIFSNSSAAFAGGRVTTTNPLLGGYQGAVGMKTGFTCRAGYNIAGLADRDGRRILAVTMSHPNSGARNASVRKQLDRGFAAAAEGPSLGPAAARTEGSPSDVAVCAPGGAPSASPRGWSVYLGAYRSRGGAQAALNRARKLVKGAKGRTYVGKRRLNRSWAAVAHSFNRAGSRRFCVAARRAGLYCVVLPPSRTTARNAPWR